MRIALQTEIPGFIDKLPSIAPNMMEQIIAPFFANVIAFSDDQPLQGVVATTAGY